MGNDPTEQQMEKTGDNKGIFTHPGEQAPVQLAENEPPAASNLPAGHGVHVPPVGL